MKERRTTMELREKGRNQSWVEREKERKKGLVRGINNPRLNSPANVKGILGLEFQFQFNLSTFRPKC